jgi:S-adenosyl methyltransferase
VDDAQKQDRLAARGLDVTVPNVARIYDFILGGKDNFDADRAAAAQLLAVIPGGSGPARMNRAFLGRVVYFLAAERGIRQFLDIGSGLPTASNVHEIAQAAAPDARVVYVDSDPVVVLHAQAILEDRAKGVAAVRGDLRDPAGITASPAVRELIDFSQPVAVLLFAVLHFVPDADDPRALLARFRDVMAPGSALALSHITAENIDEEAARAGRAVYQSASAPIVPRSRAQIEGFFDGLDLLAPGVADISHWPEPDPGGAALHFYGGVAVKPAVLPVLPRGQLMCGCWRSVVAQHTGSGRFGGPVLPVEAGDRLLHEPKVPVHRVLAIRLHPVLLDDSTVYPVPHRPPDGRRDVLGVELDAQVDVVHPAHNRPAILALLRGHLAPVVECGGVFQGNRLPFGQCPRERNTEHVGAVPDLVAGGYGRLAAVADPQCERRRVVDIRDAVQPVAKRLDHLYGPDPANPSVRSDEGVVVQRDRLVAGRAEQLGHPFRRVRTDRPGAREHAHSGGSLPQPP